MQIENLYFWKKGGGIQDPLHNGPYVRIPETQNGTVRLSLKGNTVLKWDGEKDD